MAGKKSSKKMAYKNPTEQDGGAGGGKGHRTKKPPAMAPKKPRKK